MRMMPPAISANFPMCELAIPPMNTPKADSNAVVIPMAIQVRKTGRPRVGKVIPAASASMLVAMAAVPRAHPERLATGPFRSAVRFPKHFQAKDAEQNECNQ